MGVGKLDNNKNVQQLIASSDTVTMSVYFYFRFTKSIK